MTPDYRDQLKPVEQEKKEVDISEEDKALLEKYEGSDDLELSSAHKNVLSILTKRKTVEMITREFNMAILPIGPQKRLSKEEISKILKDLKDQNLVKSVIGGDEQEYWVDVKFLREKLFGTEKL